MTKEKLEDEVLNRIRYFKNKGIEPTKLRACLSDDLDFFELEIVGDMKEGGQYRTTISYKIGSFGYKTLEKFRADIKEIKSRFSQSN